MVVGHSMGSTNALRFAIDRPARVRGLVLIGAFAAYGGNPGIVKFYETAIAPPIDSIDPAFVREFQESTLAQPVSESFRDDRKGAPQSASARLACRVCRAVGR